MKTLSIVVPVWNERETISKILSRVRESPLEGLEKEIIVIDDGSTDGTREILQDLEKTDQYKIFYQEQNRGKGVAVRLGFSKAGGDYIIIQDADLEYDPRDYQIVLEPLLDGRADVVYGSRFISTRPRRVLFFWHYLGNKFITTLSNILTNLNLSDIETCYKAFSRSALEKIAPRLKSNRFGIEPEITAQVAKQGLRVYEVGISYAGRTYKEGKKINWKDGLATVWFIIKYNLLE